MLRGQEAVFTQQHYNGRIKGPQGSQAEAPAHPSTLLLPGVHPWREREAGTTAKATHTPAALQSRCPWSFWHSLLGEKKKVRCLAPGLQRKARWGRWASLIFGHDKTVCAGLPKAVAANQLPDPEHLALGCTTSDTCLTEVLIKCLYFCNTGNKNRLRVFCFLLFAQNTAAMLVCLNFKGSSSSLSSITEKHQDTF